MRTITRHSSPTECGGQMRLAPGAPVQWSRLILAKTLADIKSGAVSPGPIKKSPWEGGSGPPQLEAQPREVGLDVLQGQRAEVGKLRELGDRIPLDQLLDRRRLRGQDRPDAARGQPFREPLDGRGIGLRPGGPMPAAGQALAERGIVIAELPIAILEELAAELFPLQGIRPVRGLLVDPARDPFGLLVAADHAREARPVRVAAKAGHELLERRAQGPVAGVEHLLQAFPSAIAVEPFHEPDGSSRLYVLAELGDQFRCRFHDSSVGGM